MLTESCQTSLPKMVAEPPDERRIPSNVRMVVDLPAPFGPIKPKTSPLLTLKVISFNASNFQTFFVND